jgi:hypothetical protein
MLWCLVLLSLRVLFLPFAGAIKEQLRSPRATQQQAQQWSQEVDPSEKQSLGETALPDSW